MIRKLLIDIFFRLIVLDGSHLKEAIKLWIQKILQKQSSEKQLNK